MKNSTKGFVPLVLLIIIAVAAIGGGTYVYTKHKEAAQTEAAKKVDSSTNITANNSTSTSDSSTFTAFDFPIKEVGITLHIDNPLLADLKYTIATPRVSGEAADTSSPKYVAPKIGINFTTKSLEAYGCDVNTNPLDSVVVYTKTNQDVTNLQKYPTNGLLAGNSAIYFSAHQSGCASQAGKSLETKIFPVLRQTIVKSKTNITTAPVTTKADIREYNNSQYGFSFLYPSTLAVAESRDTGNAFNTPATSQVIRLTTSGTQYNNGTFNVFIAESASAISSCLTAPVNTEIQVSNVTKTKINGTQFLSFQAFSPAAGQFMWWQEYHAMYKNQCFIISSQINGTESSHLSDAQQKQTANSELDSLKAMLDSIVKTFKFN